MLPRVTSVKMFGSETVLNDEGHGFHGLCDNLTIILRSI
jgi:hypothetical protein